MRRRFLIVHNPAAGRNGLALTRKVSAELERRGACVVYAPPRVENGPVVSGAMLEGFDAAIASGGDGTFRALAAAVGETGLPIGLIPAGTGNVLANEIGLTKNAAELARVLMEGPLATVEAASVNGAPFYLMVGAGFDGEVIARLSQRWKKRVGRAAYTAPTLAALGVPQQEIAVTVDGRDYRCGWVVVSKAQRYGGAFTIAPEAVLTGRAFHVVMFKSLSVATRVLQLMIAAAGLIERAPGIEIVQGAHIRIACTPPVKVQVDGDEAGTTPVEIVHGTARLSLIVPPSYRGRS